MWIETLLPSFSGNNGKVLKLVDGNLEWGAAGTGSFDGTMDDIEDGETYVKTENNYTDAEKTKLAAIADGATANATNAELRDRTTHTGEQAISTITGLQTALDSKAAALGADDNYVTDAEKVKLSNLSGTNSGDQDLSSLALKATTITINGDAKDLSVNRSWTITSSLPELVVTKNTSTANQTIAAGYSAYIPQFYEIANTFSTEISNTAILEIG